MISITCFNLWCSDLDIFSWVVLWTQLDTDKHMGSLSDMVDTVGDKWWLHWLSSWHIFAKFIDSFEQWCSRCNGPWLSRSLLSVNHGWHELNIWFEKLEKWSTSNLGFWFHIVHLRGGFLRVYSSKKKDKRVKEYVMVYAIWCKVSLISGSVLRIGPLVWIASKHFSISLSQIGLDKLCLELCKDCPLYEHHIAHNLNRLNIDTLSLAQPYLTHWAADKMEYI